MSLSDMPSEGPDWLETLVDRWQAVADRAGDHEAGQPR
jgi:hypothetical protein